MLEKIKRLKKAQDFNPTLIGVFLNPYFITRRRLSQHLSKIISNVCFDNNNDLIIDLGCGSSPYKKLFPSKNYLGVDIHQNGHSDENDNNHVDIIYDGENLPFQDSTIDLVFSSQVFEHIHNLDTVLKDVYRTLKPGGKLIASIPFVWDEHEIPFDYRRFTSFGVVDILEKHGCYHISLEKDTNFIEALAQMLIEYIWQYIFPKNSQIKFLLTPVIIAPITIAALALAKILPKSDGFFLNTVVYAEKK